MTFRTWTAGAAIALGLATVAVPALAQGIEFGPNGARIVGPREDNDYDSRTPQRDDNRTLQRGDNRDMQRAPNARRGSITQRDAIRIARRQGLADLDGVTERARIFRVDGVDRDGDDITVDIDKRSGAVVSVR